MTKRQKIFIREYLVDLNATRAAVSAGYSEKTASEQASRLLTNVKIKSEIEHLLQKTMQRLDITVEKVLGELAKLGFANMKDYIKINNGDPYVDFSALTRDQAAAIQEVTVEEYTEGRGEDKRDIKRTKFKLAEKRGSLELLGKYLKLFTDRVEHTGTITHEHFDASKLTDEQLAEADKLIESAHVVGDQE